MQIKFHKEATVEAIAVKIAGTITQKNLQELREDAMANCKELGNPDARALQHTFRVATIIHYYLIGRDPETWLTDDDDIDLARSFLGLRTRAQQLELAGQQKTELRDKGWLK